MAPRGYKKQLKSTGYEEVLTATDSSISINYLQDSAGMELCIRNLQYKESTVMKVLPLILAFCLYSLTGIAQDLKRVNFEKATKLPVGMYGMAHSTDNNRLFVVGGGSNRSPYTASLYEYNPQLETWTDLSGKSRLKPSRYGRALYLQEFESMILLGGTSPHASAIILTPDYTIYDLKTYRAKVLCQNPFPTKLPGVAYWKGDVYVFGGSLSAKNNLSGKVELEFTRQMYVYNPRTGIVQVLPDLPEAKETAGGIMEGRLYTFGGFGSHPSKRIDVYNILTAEWQEIGSFENPVSAYALVAYDHYFILLGDYKKSDQMIVFDTKTNTWEVYQMNFRGRHMGAEVLKGILHVFGGFSPRGNKAMRQHWTLDLAQFLGENHQTN